MARNVNEEASAKWKDLKGYDIKTVEGNIEDAPFVPKTRSYQRYWALWGFKFFKRSWKRQKIYSWENYITVLVAVMPGVWMDQFMTAVTDLGAAHIFQVFICLVFISVTLLYADCFLGDYTKRSACYIWNAMPISYCLFPLQLITVVIESQIGSVRAIIYFQRFINHFFFKDAWNTCLRDQYDNLKCFDEDTDTLSKRCESDDVWVICPDKTKYILPTHYNYLRECNWQILFSPDHVCYLLLYWFIVALIATRGLMTYAKLIKWIFISVLLLYVTMLLYLLTICGKEAIYSVSIMSALDVAPFMDFKAWLFAFWVSLKLCSWGMMTNWTIASGLIFRTGRWMDCLLLMTFAMLGILFNGIIRFGFTGCLAKRIHTRIDTIWKLRGITYTDAIIPYYLSNLPPGPLFTAIHHFSSFVLSIWSYAGLVDALIYGMAELHGLLEWQPTLLLVFVLLSIPLSIVILSFAQCGLIHNTPVRTAYTSLQLIYMTGYAVTVFWLYGARTMDEDHYFMYGYRPLGFIPSTWPWIPFIFIIAIIGDIYHNSLLNIEKLLACILTHLLCCLIIFLGIIILTLRQKRRKHPYSHLFKPVFTWGPPNGPLRRARKRFMPHTAHSLRETSRYSYTGYQHPSQLDREIYRQYAFRGSGLATDLQTSHWKKLIHAGMHVRGEKNADLINKATRSLVYAEDVSFFELTNLEKREDKHELPGILPPTVRTVLVDELDETQNQDVEYMEVVPIEVKDSKDSVAEGLKGEEAFEPPHLEKQETRSQQEDEDEHSKD